MAHRPMNQLELTQVLEAAAGALLAQSQVPRDSLARMASAVAFIACGISVGEIPVYMHEYLRRTLRHGSIPIHLWMEE